jgi:hypothetical protein
MPDELREAVLAARRMTAHGAIARQRQYLGRLMRDIDPRPFATRSMRSMHAATHTLRIFTGWSAGATGCSARAMRRSKTCSVSIRSSTRSSCAA